MAALQQHVASIKSAYYTQDSRALLAAFRLDPTTFSALQADLNKNVGAAKGARTESHRSQNGS